MEGDAPVQAPWAFQVEKYAKWTAWNEVRGKSKDAAMAEYIAIIKELNLK